MLYVMGVAMLVYTFPAIAVVGVWTLGTLAKTTLWVLTPASSDEARIRRIVQSEMEIAKNNLQVGGCDLVLSS